MLHLSSFRAVLARLLVLPFSALTVLSACSPSPEPRLLASVVESSVLPAYFTYKQASENLVVASRAFCQTVDEEHMESVRQSWRDSASAWAGPQVMPFGPITEDNISWQVQFWPDRKNLVARKIEALLRGGDEINDVSLAQASVIIRGLSAAEYLLFDVKGGQLAAYQRDSGAKRCALLQTIADYQQNIATRLYHSWDADGGNYTATFTQPGPDNPDYPDVNLAVAAIAESLIFGAELIKRDKIERPMGLDRESPLPQPYLVEWWRSRYSREMILANLTAMHRLYSGDAQEGLAAYLAAKGHAKLSQEVDEAFQRALVAVNALDSSLFEVASDPRGDPRVTRLYVTVSELLTLLKRDLPKALNITLSFNSKDGD